MKKRRIISLALSCFLTAGLLIGCGTNDTQTIEAQDVELDEIVREIADANAQYFEQFYDVPESRVFEPGEHVIFIRYNYASSAESFTSGRVDIPEGYEILSIENFTEKYGYGSQTGGADIWYINTETVLVDPVYKSGLRNDNSQYGYYDYSRPGVVIQKENEEENSLTK